MTTPPLRLNRLQKLGTGENPHSGAIATIPSIQTVQIMARRGRGDRMDHRRPRERPIDLGSGNAMIVAHIRHAVREDLFDTHILPIPFSIAYSFLIFLYFGLSFSARLPQRAMAHLPKAPMDLARADQFSDDLQPRRCRNR